MTATTTTRTASKTAQRIERLRALAGDGNPNEHEREVARRALGRMIERLGEQRSAWEPEWQGEKYQSTRGMGMTQITKLIRDEVRLLRKLGKQSAAAKATEAALKISEPIGDAPAEIKISISQPHYGSVSIKLTNIPQDWGWRWGTDPRDPWQQERWIPTDALEALGKELNRLGNAYNYDNSDVMTDYFDRRYYLNVDACEPGRTYANHGIGYRH